MLLWLAGCVSLVETQTQWQAYLDVLPACEIDEDCAIIEPGCPLGCYESVPAGFQGEAQSIAEGLADDYRGFLRPCVYECGPRPVAFCDLGTGRCATGAAGSAASPDVDGP